MSGQQIGSAQGNLSSAGSSTVKLKSRKVGGGSSTRALSGNSSPVSIGAVSPTPQVAPTGIAVLLSAGAMASSRAAMPTGASTSALPGFVNGGSPAGQTPGTVLQLGTVSMSDHMIADRTASAEGLSAANARMNVTSTAMDYSGAAMRGNRWTNVVSGGHSGSMDDGLYEFDTDPVSATFLQWITSTPFSTDGHLSPPRAGDASNEWLIDATYPTRVSVNRPAAQHSYWHNVAFNNNVYNLMGYAVGNSSAGSRQAHWWSSATGTWDRYGTNSGNVAINECYCFHDVVRKRFVRLNAVANATAVDFITDSDPTAAWSTTFMSNAAPMPADIYSGAGYHPVLDCFVVISPHDFGPTNTKRAFVLDLANIASGFTEVTTSLASGSTAIPYPSTYPGLTYYPPKNCLVAADQSDATGRTLYYLTPTGMMHDPWIWTSETLTGSASVWDPSLTGIYNRIQYSPGLQTLVTVKSPTTLPESFAPALASNWASRSTEAGVVVAYDFSSPPANGGTVKWGSLSASPHVTCYQQNDAYYGSHVNVVTDVYPPGSTASLCWDVPDGPHGQQLFFSSSVSGLASGVLSPTYPDISGGTVTFSDGTVKTGVSISGGVMSWSGNLPSSPAITSCYLSVGERGDLWWISIDDYADQFGDNAEFWVQWRTRMNSSYATYPYLQAGDTMLTSAKQIMMGEGMQTGELGMNPAWPYGYRGTGTSITQNQIQGVRVDFEGETNVIALYGVDQWTARTYPYDIIFRAPNAYHGKPTYASLISSDGTWFTNLNAGVETGPYSSARYRYQLDGQGIVNRNTGFVYPTDEWFTLMVHVKLGTRGHGFSSIPVAYSNLAATRQASNQVLLTGDTYTEHFNPAAAAGMYIRIRGATTGSVDAVVTVKDTSSHPGQALLTLSGMTGTIQNEALLVDEYENGFVNSTVEYYGAYTGGSMQLLHKRSGIVMRVGNYVYDQTGYSGTAKYGTFAWTTFMTGKSTTQAHPTGRVWVSQIIIKSGSTPPSTPT